MNCRIRLPLSRELGAALKVASTLTRSGYRCLLVGGCVRDLLLGLEPEDYDLATDAPAEAIQSRFRCVNPAGERFGVFNVVVEGSVVTLARFRRDVQYRDGRRPETLAFTGRLEEDAQRRDFTVNAIYFDLQTNMVVDPTGGCPDLFRRVLRAIGDPRQRMKEDYLRLVRAVRLATSLGFTMEEKTAAAVREYAHCLTTVSAERLREELTRLLTQGHAGRGIRMLRDSTLLRHALPEVSAMDGVPQPQEYHPEGDVFVHTCCMLDRLNPYLTVTQAVEGSPYASPITKRHRVSPRLAWATLLHDVGKPPAFRIAHCKNGKLRIRFDGHAELGAALSERILARLRFPTRFISDVCFMIRNHMRFLDVRNMRKSTLLKLMAAETFDDELELHRLDCICSHGKLENYFYLLRLKSSLSQETRRRLPERWITGRDLLVLGIPEGPRIGRLLHLAYDAQLEGKFRTREELLTWLEDIAREENTPVDQISPSSRPVSPSDAA
ncbi:MAG TPA: CCA tRNA nucleotidyltransferase [Kiritimatiellae bacterium]|nr:CCA tRNA nucleotidyltransferase [Kiritimatiellia bacterium]